MDNSVTTRMRNELITFAKMNKRIDYLSLSQVAGYKQIEKEKVNLILAEICIQDHKDGKPLLWTIVSDESGSLSDEYFDLLTRLGEIEERDGISRDKVYQDQLSKVFAYWSRRRKTGQKKR
jgi:hypothetical protein